MQNESDIIVVGAGLVGSVLALLLAKSGVGVTLLERASRNEVVDSKADGRASAISEASRRLFDNVGIWQALQPYGEPILDIRVVDGFSNAMVHYDHSEVGDEPFGYIVQNYNIKNVLAKAVDDSDNIEIIYDSNIESIQAGDPRNIIRATSGKEYHAPLMVAADGRNSFVRKSLNMGERYIKYGQTAIVCSIEHELPHKGLALERFLKSGPFAILPMQNNKSSIVWTEPDDMAAHMLGLEREFIEFELQKRVGDWLGSIKIAGDIYSYPLILMHADEYIAKRTVLIGDAAHSIHPIAGQGVNLGYRDVAVLAECICDAIKVGTDIGSGEVLSRYKRWRSSDIASMIAVTDSLNRLFSNDIKPISIARKIGLKSVNQMDDLKKYFMFHAMGIIGDLPELLELRT